MSDYFGDFSEDDTVYIPFNTFDSNDPSASVTITNLADADIKVHKDGSATQIVTDGATIAIDFDSITGNHLITIDTSAHADYATGSDYMVRIEGTTVDAATINAWVGSFSIENRYKHGVAQTVDNDVLASGSTGFAAIDTGVDTLLTRIIGTLESGSHNPASTAQLGALTDWLNGGRLDLLLDAIPTTAMRGTDSAGTAAELAKVPKSDSTVTWNATALASINTQCDTALTDYDGPTNAEMNARTILAASYFDPAVDAVANVTLVATTTTNTDMRGTDGANTVVPDAAGVAPTAVENRQEMDSNSTQLARFDGVEGVGFLTATDSLEAIRNRVGSVPTATQNREEMDSSSTQLSAIVLDTGTTLPGLIDDLAVKKNATFSNFEFLMVLTSDGRTPATGLTVTGQRSIDGAAFTGVSGTIAEVSNGIYQFDAIAADTNGDLITWRFISATADDTFVTFKTVA